MHIHVCTYTHGCTQTHRHTYISAQNDNQGNAVFFAKGEEPSWKHNKTQMTCTS